MTGQSMGGAGTFGAIFLRPELFAAAIPGAGGWDPQDAGKMKNIRKKTGFVVGWSS